MKKIVFSALILSSFLFTSCEPKEETKQVCADFENLELTEAGVINNAVFSSGDLSFSNIFNEEYQSWDGFAASSHTDTETAGFENQYSVITGKAYSGSQFAVAYQGMENPKITAGKSVQFKTMYITNGTYAYLTIKDGNEYCKKFVDGDFFNVKFTGHAADGSETGSVTVYLADFRDGKSDILKTWQSVDLTPLGTCTEITLSFDSTDKGEWGINTPTYVMLDDITYIVAE